MNAAELAQHAGLPPAPQQQHVAAIQPETQKTAKPSPLADFADLESLLRGADKSPVIERVARIAVAKRYPRDPVEVWDRVNTACERWYLAKKAFYSYKRGGQSVSGASIELIEEVARCYGNLDYGWKEVTRDQGESYVEAWAHDLETDVRSNCCFWVKHRSEYNDNNTKQKMFRVLESDRDIYECVANNSARRMRTMLERVLPTDLIERAKLACQQTVANGFQKETPEDRTTKMVAVFKEIGVSLIMLTEYLGHPLNKITSDEFVELIGVYEAVRNNDGKWSDFVALKQNQ